MEYELLEELGRGGMGRVHRARHKSSGRIVAIKTLHPDMDKREEAQRRFEREIKACTKLAHPVIIEILDAGREGDQWWFAMEYLEGASPLSTVLREDGPLEVDQAMDVARSVLDALAYVHEKGLLHRDIKSSNVMLGPADRVTLMDFGLVTGENATRLTAEGGLVGTPGCWAPETLQGAKASTAVDLWGVGILLYEMLAASHPFYATNVQNLIANIQCNPPEPLTKRRPGTPATLDPVILRFLEKDPAKRIASAKEALALLEEWTVRQGMESTATLPAGRLRRPKKTLPPPPRRKPVELGPARPPRQWSGLGLAAGAIVLGLPLMAMGVISLLHGQAEVPPPPPPAPSLASAAPADPFELGTRMRQRLAAFAPAARLRHLIEEVTRAPGRTAGKMDVERREWAARLTDTLASAGVPEAVDAFVPVRDAYYRSESVGGADKQALYALVDELVDLEAAVQRAGIEVAVPGRRLQSPEYGQLPGEPAAPVEGVMIALDPTFAGGELKMTPGSPRLYSKEPRHRMRTMGDVLDAPGAMVDMLSTSQFTPQDTIKVPPGLAELRARISHLDADAGIRFLIAQRPDDAAAAWRVIARVRPPSGDALVARHAIPANVIPSGPFAVRAQIAYCGMRAVLSSDMRQGGRLLGFGIGRRQ